MQALEDIAYLQKTINAKQSGLTKAIKQRDLLTYSIDSRQQEIDYLKNLLNTKQLEYKETIISDYTKELSNE